MQIGSKRELSFDELRRMLVEKHRSVRRARLDYFRRTGQVRVGEKTEPSPSLRSLRIESGENLAINADEHTEKRKRSPWMDRVLLLVEFGAVAGLLAVLFNGLLMVQNINREMASVLEQPTLAPTALIMAVVLPSGHTPPNSPDGVRPNDAEIPDRLYETEPDKCCDLLKVEPTRQAIESMDVKCWVTGLRCTEGRTRTDYKEVEERDKGLVKLNPILIWKEREVWQYLALYGVKVNPLYGVGYRSLGCEPCTHITTEDNERAGRWIGTSKCGGECGIHTRPLKTNIGGDGI